MATAPEIQAEPAGESAEPAPINVEDFYGQDGRAPEQEEQREDGGEQQEGEQPAEGAEEPNDDAIEAPKSWSKEDREAWHQIPRAQQEIISRRETERDRHLRQVTTQASQTEQRIQAQAREALQTITSNHAAQLEQYAKMFEVPQPDLRLLNSQNPADRDLYFQQEAQYRAAAAHRETANRQALEARQHAEALKQHERQVAQQEFAKVLSESIPEWSDPSARANGIAELAPIATELGYSAEVQSEANATDILALRKAFNWKAKADKYDALMKQKMVPVRAAKNVPPNARTPAPNTGSSQPTSDLALLYPNDQPRR
jgi:hypothetical protein